MNGLHQVLVGDCIELMRAMGDQSVNCCVTSPPYFGRRDYGIDGQIGLEARAPEYVGRLVSVFREVHRVLADDGCLFVNLGDTYAGFKYGKFPPQSQSKGNQRGMPASGAPHRSKALLQMDGFKNKELMGIPWRFAFAMQDAGWYLRQDIIWAKPNYTPERVRDRFVKSHEHIFLFTKLDSYWFDGDSVRIRAASGGKKLRTDVWTVPVSKFKGAHFATFPVDLVRPCIRAGCPPDGLVLDPFGGDASTGVAAMLEGRRSIMCELNPSYAKMARARLSEAWLGGSAQIDAFSGGGVL